MRVHPARVTALRPGAQGAGPVLCWLSRDQRAADNWALIHAQDLALAAGVPLLAVFCLARSFPGAAARAYDFLLPGLRETAADLAERHIPLVLLPGDPGETLPGLVRELRAGAVVADFDPLRVKREWRRRACAAVEVPVAEVDAHNIVPCRRVSDKQEYAARTIRPKIHKLLPEFLDEFPELEVHPHRLAAAPGPPDWEAARAFAAPDETVSLPPAARPGSGAGLARLEAFLDQGLDRYAEGRNDPNQEAQSGLSPWLHFGQVAPQRVALEAVRSRGGRRADANLEAFLEELVVRRELSDNFCWRNPHYDSLEGAPEWARRTLARHARDPRPFLYSREEFAAGATHDGLWNAAQRQMAATGKMHGYLRMYWAKKILEWSPDAAGAVRTALWLNDRWSLDGRDPNGCVGVLWSCAGLHDRPWGERPVFGAVRSMTAAGCARKFDVAAYARRWAAS
ncbi:MAG: deoxyribodipyrimidine photo-lyase [Thermodesulfobacteriota bacterium]